MSYNSKLPEDIDIKVSRADVRENLRALKEDKIVDAATAVVADSAAKLTTARKIALGGDATGSTSFDGSADVAIKVDVLNADNADTLNGKSETDIIHISSPAGAVQYFAMASAPAGWLKADGLSVSRTDYANLFTAIGTIFGTGDGSTTFNLPDLRGEFIRSFDDGRGVDSKRIFGSWQEDMFKSHTHSIRCGYNYMQHSDTPDTNDVGRGSDDSGYPTFSTGGTETRPRNLALLACIKY